MMMRSTNQVNLFRNGATLISSTFLAGSHGKGNVFYYNPRGPLINIKNALAANLNAIYAMYLQPVLFNKMEYQPVWVR